MAARPPPRRSRCWCARPGRSSRPPGSVGCARSRPDAAPDRPERAAALDAELALAAAAPPELLRGDPVELLPDAVARVPADALPVVTTAWAMPSLPREGRHRFLQRLDEAAAGRTLAW